MPTDKIRKYILPNIPYLFIGWACLKLGTAYRLAAGAGFGEKLLGLGRSIGPAFADFAPGLDPFDWLVGLVGAVAFRLLIYFKSKNAKKYRRDEEYDDGLDFKLIGRRVRDFRQMRGLTQEKLAEAAELSVPYVSHIERGARKASISTLIKIAGALDVTVDALLLGWQPNEAVTLDSDVKSLLGDCSPRERQVLIKITMAVKQILRDVA